MFMILKCCLTYWLYLYIRGVGCKVMYVLRVCVIKTRTHTPRVGTAASVGATRAHPATGPLASIPFEIFLISAIFL